MDEPQTSMLPNNDAINDQPIPNDMGNDNGDIGDDVNMGDDTDNMDNTDPKKHIQQLCGSLSQELRQYNQNQDKPDTELNKYVAGMIIPQTVKDMTPKEKNHIISKINQNDFDGGESDTVDNQDLDDDMQDNGDNDMPMENKKYLHRALQEIISAQQNTNQHRYNKKSKNKLHKNPFVSNR